MTTNCNACGDPDGQGNTLAAPRRNRYYYGKLLDVSHMAMEQDYGKKKRWLMNRLAVGTGVLCGLDVSAKDGKVCVSGGVAIDSFGREIIVPGTYCIDPWKLPADCGDPVTELSRDEAHVVQLRLCYRECTTDQAPVQVSDCNSTAACEAGTTIESFGLEIVEGLPDPAVSEVCALMHLNADELGSTAAADIPALIRQRLCEQLPHPCAGSADCCVLLAVIELLPDSRIGAVRSCAVRTVLYSNAMLFEMILCLAARIEQCCGGDPAPPPPPPPKTQLQVQGVRILDAGGNEMASFANPGQTPTVPAQKLPTTIEVTFTEEVDPNSVITGTYPPVVDPKTFSFLVAGNNPRYLHPYVPGTMQFPADRSVVRFVVDPHALDGLSHLLPGKYKVSLFGSDVANPARPAIATPGAPAVPVRLDGEVNAAFPSGNGVEGGTFVCVFNVK